MKAILTTKPFASVPTQKRIVCSFFFFVRGGIKRNFDLLYEAFPENVLTMSSLSLSVHRVLKVVMTPSTWHLSPWWLQIAPSGTQLSQSQKNSWSRCSPASLLFVKSRKPLTCPRTCTSWTEGEWKTNSALLSSPSLWLLFMSSFVYSHTLLWSLRVACIVYVYFHYVSAYLTHTDCKYTYNQ